MYQNDAMYEFINFAKNISFDEFEDVQIELSNETYMLFSEWIISLVYANEKNNIEARPFLSIEPSKAIYNFIN